ncbi:PaaI family thioesterase [Shewanella maritima]|uniref:PaaI family thioesterase n=1 Tax=Shewanella maritima TaxID=2520507 RepID=UPI003734F8CB
MKHVNGLEVMQAMVNGEFPAPSMAKTIPMRAIKVAYGSIEFEAIANERHLNPMGGVHGGFAATVLDSVTGCAVHSALDIGQSYSTIELQVKMVRPIPVGQPVFAIGNLINKSKSLAIAEAKLHSKEGKLLATATASCLLSLPS